MDRRQFLASSAGLVAVAGCVDAGPTEQESPPPASRTSGPGPPSIAWTREYGPQGGEATYTPGGSPSLYARSMVPTGDGEYALTGGQSEEGEVIDAYIQVTDSGGRTRWLREYGSEYFDTPTSDPDTSNRTPGDGDVGNRAYCIVRTADGGFLLGGVAAGTGWVLKTDDTGDPEWYAAPADGTRSALQGAVQTRSGGYALTGWKEGSNGTRGWFVKLDSEGVPLVDESYDTAADDPAAIAEEFESVVETSDEGFVHVGEYVGGGWILKTGPQGEKRWETFLDAPYVKANDVIETDDGNYLVTGRVTTVDRESPYHHTEALVSSNLSLTLIDGSGAVQWTETYPGTDGEFGEAVVPTADGGYAAAGGREPRGRSFDRSVVVVKTAGDGTMEWKGTYLDAGVGRAISQASDGGFAIAADRVFLKIGP